MNPSLVLKENEEQYKRTSNPDGTMGDWQQIHSVSLKKITLLPFFPSIGYTRAF